MSDRICTQCNGKLIHNYGDSVYFGINWYDCEDCGHSEIRDGVEGREEEDA